MNKWFFLVLLVGSVFYFHGYWGKEAPKDPSLAGFHKEIKVLFEREEYQKVVRKLKEKIDPSLPKKLRRQYEKLLTIAQRLASKKEVAQASPRERKLGEEAQVTKGKKEAKLAKKPVKKEKKKSTSPPPQKTGQKTSKRKAASETSRPEKESTVLVSDGSEPPSFDYPKALALIEDRPHSKEALGVAGAVAKKARQKGDRVARYRALSVLFIKGKKTKFKKELDSLVERLILSPQSSALTKTHRVQKGDFLYKIGRKYNCPWPLIVQVNRMSSPQVRLGQKLIVPAGKRKILVDKSDFSLLIVLNGFYLRHYEVGLGKNNSTPEGTFLIKTKQKNPAWYWKGKKYPYGHPKNILGTRWLGFKNTAKFSGYGIHGTSKPETIGKNDSSGCVRMYNRDVEEVYKFVPRGTQVVISK